MREPLISLGMIVKNGEKNLPRCLESVRGIVDEIIVVAMLSQSDFSGLCPNSGGLSLFPKTLKPVEA